MKFIFQYIIFQSVSEAHSTPELPVASVKASVAEPNHGNSGSSVQPAPRLARSNKAKVYSKNYKI